MHGIKQDFHYVRFMKREKEAMTFKLGVLMKEQEEGMATEMTNEQRTKEMMKGSSVLASNLFKDCALCEKTYRPWNLPGKIPFKAIVEWRKNHAQPFGFDNAGKVEIQVDKVCLAKVDGKWVSGMVDGESRNSGGSGKSWDVRLDSSGEIVEVERALIKMKVADRRLAQFRIYEPVPLCLFCTQFFDTDFSDYVEYHLGSTDIRDPALEIEDNSGTKNELNPDVTKKLQDYAVNHIIQSDYIRPTSAFMQEMEMDALRDKKYVRPSEASAHAHAPASQQPSPCSLSVALCGLPRACPGKSTVHVVLHCAGSFTHITPYPPRFARRYLPKLMSSMGCELARAVRPENQKKTLFTPTTQHAGLGSGMRNKKKGRGGDGQGPGGVGEAGGGGRGGRGGPAAAAL